MFTDFSVQLMENINSLILIYSAFAQKYMNQRVL